MKNSKGFTLVELLIAFAIAAIAGVAVFSFMQTSSLQYNRMTKDIGLQYDQQVSVNQLKDMIMGTTNAIVYIADVNNAEAAPTPEVPEGAEATPTPEADGAAKESLLVLFNYDKNKMVEEDDGTKTTTPFEAVFIEMVEDEDATSQNGDGTTLYKLCKSVASYNTLDTFKTFTNSGLKAQAGSDKGVIAENVVSFEMDLTKSTQRKVYFKIKFKKNEREYITEEAITLRNPVDITGDVKKIDFDVLYDPVINTDTDAITEIVISRDGKAITTGKDELKISRQVDTVVYQYEATVKAKTSTEIEWGGATFALEGAPTGVQIDSATGVLTIDTTVLNPSVTTYTFKLKAISVANANKWRSIDVTLRDNGVYPVKVEIQTPVTGGTKGTRTYEFSHVTTFTDNSTSSDPELVKWTCSTLPDGCQLVDNKLILNSNANDMTIEVTCTVKEKSATNEEVKSFIILPISGIPEFVVGTELKITVTSRVDRGNTFNTSVHWANNKSSRYTYEWKVEKVDPLQAEVEYKALQNYILEQEGLIKEYQDSKNPLASVTWDSNYANQGYDSLHDIMTRVKNEKGMSLSSWNTTDSRTTFDDVLYFYGKAEGNWQTGKIGSTTKTGVTTRNCSLYCKSYLTWDKYYVFKVTCKATTLDNNIKPGQEGYSYTSTAYGLVEPVELTIKETNVVEGERDLIDTNSSVIETDPVLLMDDPYNCTTRRACEYMFSNIRITGLKPMSSLDSPANWEDVSYTATSTNVGKGFMYIQAYRGGMFYDLANVRKPWLNVRDWTDRSKMTIDFNMTKFYPQSYWPDEFRFRAKAKDKMGNSVISNNFITYKPSFTKMHPKSRYTLQDIKNYYRK